MSATRFARILRGQKTGLLAITILAAVLLVTLYPWNSPVYDAQLSGFDKTYLYIDPQGTGASQGNVTVSQNRLTITSTPGSAPLVDVASSELSYTAQFDLTIASDSPTSIPMRLAVLFPQARENVTVDFNGSNRSIEGYVVQRGSITHYNSNLLGTYSPNQAIHVTVSITRGRDITITQGNRFFNASYTAGIREAPTLLTTDRRVLMVEAVGNQGSTAANLENLLIRIPHDEFFAPTSNDPALPIAYFSATVLVIAGFRQQFRKVPRLLARAVSKLRDVPRLVWILVLVSLTIQLAVTPLGNHPHDIFSEKIWIYTMMTSGLASLYFRPLVTVVAQAFGGVPNQHAVFPYPPLLGYFYYVAGWPLELLGIFSVQNFAFELAAKMINILGNLASGLLVYLVAGQLAMSKRKSTLAAAAYLMNPALVFDAAIWGETDSILIMFLIASVLFLFLKRPSLVWTSLALAFLTKQTAAVPALAIGALSFRQCGFPANLRGLAIGLSAAFLAVGPYVLVGFSPFVMFSQTILRLSQFATGSITFPTSTPISNDAYSLLPLISPLSGLSGRSRMWSPDVSLVPGLGVSYSLLGRVLFAAAALPTAYLGLQKTSLERKDLNLLFVALLTLSSDFFPTRISGRYFLIPLALLIPMAFASARREFRISVWTLTGTTFVSMFYLIAGWSVFAKGSPLSPGFLALAPFSTNLFDWALDVAVLANLLVFLGLMKLLYDGRKPGA